jgi:hypothetical protein
VDLDGDGRMDLVSVNADGPSLVAFLHPPSGFGQPYVLLRGEPLVGPESVAAEDLDQDGLVDLAVADPGAGVFVVRQSEPGSHETIGPLLPETPGPYALALVDIDHDGLVDVVSADLEGSWAAFLQEGVGAFFPRPSIEIPTGFPTISVAAADLDGDLDIDVATVTTDLFSDGLKLFPGLAPGVFDPVPVVVPGTALIRFVAFADVDGDGELDLVSRDFARLRIHYRMH